MAVDNSYFILFLYKWINLSVGDVSLKFDKKYGE